MFMNIATFAELTSLTAHTLRYYEKLGLLNNVSRSSNGHRCYSQADVEWVNFINRLKSTGMHLANILEYAHLRAEGEATFAQRRILLESHRDALHARIEKEIEHLQALNAKIIYYHSQNPLT
jgi:DNA-binding transcriptional MerR regulator